MDDNIWEYPFGEIDEDEDLLFRRPPSTEIRINSTAGPCPADI
jgi:hypothetical protein